MKKITLLAAVIVIASSFATSAFAGQNVISDKEKVSEIISNYYPELEDYYNAGVMSVESIQEETLIDGSKEYDITYKFVRSLCDREEADDILKEQYPEVYRMNKAGLLKDLSVCRYVVKDTGEILTNVSYNTRFPQPKAAPRAARRFRHEDK